MKEDKLIYRLRLGKPMISAIRIDGVSMRRNEWCRQPGVVITPSGLSKRLRFREITGLTLKECVFNALVPQKSNRKKGRYTLNWHPWQDDVIRKWYPGGGSFACLHHLPGRNPKQIVSQAAALGVRVEDKKRFRKEAAERKTEATESDERALTRRLWGAKAGEVFPTEGKTPEFIHSHSSEVAGLFCAKTLGVTA